MESRRPPADAALHPERPRPGGAVVLEVEDDGDGFDGDAALPPDGGLGLFSVRERVEMAGGHLDVDSELGGGTRATITVRAEGAANGAADRGVAAGA